MRGGLAPRKKSCAKNATAPATRSGRRRQPSREMKSARRAGNRLGLHRNEALALHLLAGELAGAADRLGALAGALFRRLLIMAAELHFAENAFALHLLFQRLERLIDIVVA